MLSQETTQIGKVRIRGATEDQPTIRLSLDSYLSRADLRPFGLPPAAVFIVRQLRDLPSLTAGRLQPDLAWEQAVRQALTALYSSAACCHRGVIPTQATAVLFADEAEMLACLALDISRGEVSQRWWWQALQRTLPPTDSLPTLLCQKAIHVPAALQSLMDWGQVVAVLQALSSSQALTVLAAIRQAYHLPDWQLTEAHLPEPAATESPAPPATGAELSADGRSALTVPPSLQPALPPWQIPLSAARHLTREQLCLLGVSLAVRQQPTMVRQAAFGQAVRHWWARAAQSVQPHELPASGEAVDSAVISAKQMESRAGETAVSAPQSPGNAQSRPQPPLAATTNNTEPAQTAHVPDIVPHQPITADEQHGTAPALPLPQRVWSEGVATQLGGLLYLINLMHYLDLPACFEADWQLASQVGPWGVLELLGRALLPDGRAWDDDPLWELLATLDGRQPGELPGSNFKGRDSNQLPPHWIEANDSPWPWATCALPDRGWLERLNPQLRRWLALVLPFVRWRLGQALGLADDEAASAISQTLLEVPARLFVTSSHIDLVLRLEDISLPVRLAGLDRNPGWLPDFGRVVLFHFE